MSPDPLLAGGVWAQDYCCDTLCVFIVYTLVLVWLIMSYQHSEPEHFQLLAEVRIRMCSLEPRFSVPDFVLQLWRKIGGFSKAARQNPEQKAWVRG